MFQYSKIREILSTLKDVDVDKVVSTIGEKLRVYPTLSYFSIHEEYLKELDQKENLCGAFTASYILRGLGYKTCRNEIVDQDYVAYLARVNVDPSDIEKLRILKKEIESLPRVSVEELSKRYRSIWYRFEDLPTTQKSEELGASPEGIIHAIHEVAMSRLKAIPVKTFSKIDGNLLTKEKMDILLNMLKESEKYGVQAILNLNTKHLLDSEKIPKLSEKLLLRERFEEVFRESVGHYVGYAGLIEVDSEPLIIIRETYRRYGVHLQPADYVMKALLRGDGREGGIILIVPSEVEGKLKSILLENGFKVELWDNGSPYIPFTSRRTS